MGATLENEVVSDHLADICIEERLVRVLTELTQFVEELSGEPFRGSDMLRVWFALKHEALEDGQGLQSHHHEVFKVWSDEPAWVNVGPLLRQEHFNDFI